MSLLPTDHTFSRSDVAVLLSLFVVGKVLWGWFSRRNAAKTTVLNGPPSENFFLGNFPKLIFAQDPTAVVREWAQEYGHVFTVPMAFGQKSLFLCDVRAATHLFARDTTVYQAPAFAKNLVDNMVNTFTLSRTYLFIDPQCHAYQFGRGLVWAEAEDHRR